MLHEDVVDHIAKVLEMLDLINNPGVDSHQQWMKVFPLSLTDDARQWWINEGEGKITIWEEFVENFFCKFYLESYDGEEEIWNKRRMDYNILSSNNTTTYSFFKPYLKTRKKNDTEKEDERIQMKRKCGDTSNSINEQPNKRMCKAENFEAIKYSLGPNKEYIAIRRCEYDAWERNEDIMSKIYQEILQKKDNGWKMSGEESAPQMAPVESPHVVSSVKLLILKKVIMNGDEPVQTTKDENGVETEVPPKTAQALLQRQRERKAKSILLLAIPDEYQLRFHGIKDAKTLWAAINKGLDKAYDRFQKLISQLEVHGAAISNKDANQKFLRALPSSWNNIALIMRNKEGIDELDMDDLYNNLKAFKADIKGSSGSSSNSQNVAFLSVEDTNNINEANTANDFSTAAGHNSQGKASSSSYINDLVFSFFANQSNSPQLDDEDLEQIDHDDLEEMDLKWKVLTKPRLNILTVIEGAILPGNVEQQEIKGIGMEMKAQEEPTEFALMAYTSNSSGSDTEKNEVVYEEKIAVLEFEVKDKDKTGLGYGDQLNEKDSSGSGLFNSVFDSRSSDGDDNQTNNRFKKDNGYHAVPPPLTGNYMPPLADLSFAGLDDSVYRPTANKTNASVSQVETSITPPSNTSVEMPRVEYVRPSEVIIEDWVSDDDEDIFQSNDSQTIHSVITPTSFPALLFHQYYIRFVNPFLPVDHFTTSMGYSLHPPPLTFPAVRLPSWQSHTSQGLVRRHDLDFG
ncbi:hypothetical protein Tco_1209688 [Tanacetum coccineum]